MLMLPRILIGRVKQVALHRASRNVCNKASALSSSDTTITSKENESMNSQGFCIGHVRKYDRENYLAALCIGDPRTRRAVFALRAFNVELSLVRDSTTNSDRAKLRFHFWSKLVEEIVRRNEIEEPDLDKLVAYYNYTPVAKELLEIFHLVDIDDDIKQWLNDLIGTRVSSKVLGYKLFDTMDELELYCSKSNSSLYQLAWNVDIQIHNFWYKDYSVKPVLQSISGNMGIAHGLSNVIRGIYYNSSKNCCYIPKDLLERFQLTSRDFVGRNLDTKKITPVVELLSEKCRNHIKLVHSESASLPSHYREIFLPRIAIQSNLNKLKKCNYNIGDSKYRNNNSLLPLNLWMATKFHRTPIF